MIKCCCLCTDYEKKGGWDFWRITIFFILTCILFSESNVALLPLFIIQRLYKNNRSAWHLLLKNMYNHRNTRIVTRFSVDFGNVSRLWERYFIYWCWLICIFKLILEHLIQARENQGHSRARTVLFLLKKMPLAQCLIRGYPSSINILHSSNVFLYPIHT